MKMKTAYYLTFWILALAMFSCQRSDMIDSDSSIIVYPPQDPSEGQVEGYVVDPFGNVLSGVDIYYENSQVTTDENGYYHIDNVVVYATNSSIEAEKSNYYGVTKSFNAIVNETTIVNFTLIAKSEAVDITNSSMSEVDLGNASIDFANASFVNSSDVKANSFKFQGYWLDAIPENLNSYPGSMIGVSTENAILSLASYGISNVQIIDANEQLLEFSSNSNATIIFDISSDHLPISPNTIKMWHFDDQNKIWIESGLANKQNGQYIGEIDKTGFWTFATTHDKIRLNGQLIYQDEVDHLRSHVSINSIGYLAPIQLSETGHFAIDIPLDYVLNIDVKSIHCNQENQTVSAGPFSVNSEWSQMIDVFGQDHNLSGTALACNGSPIGDGFVWYSRSNQNEYISLGEMSSFSIVEQSCEKFPFKFLLVNEADNLVSENVINESTNLSSANFTTCSSLEIINHVRFNNFQLNGVVDDHSYEWVVSRIIGSNERIIFTPTVRNIQTDEIVMTGNFAFQIGQSLAKYELHFETRGFSINGDCSVQQHTHSLADAFSFEVQSNNIEITNSEIYPLDGVGMIDIVMTFLD